MQKDLYEALDISPQANADEIKKAFRRVALICHPDRNFQNREAEERFKDANYAYSILGDEEKRRRYDLYRNFRNRSAQLGFVVPPSPVYEKILEDFFLNSSVPGFASGFQWNWDALARLHPLFSVSRSSLLFMKRLVVALRKEKVFASSRGYSMDVDPAKQRQTGKERMPGFGFFSPNGSRRSRGRPPPPPRRSNKENTPRNQRDHHGDREWDLPLSPEEAEQVTVLTLSLPSDSSWERVRLRVPPGVRNGIRLRVRNKGKRSWGGGTARGDLYLRIRVE